MVARYLGRVAITSLVFSGRSVACRGGLVGPWGSGMLYSSSNELGQRLYALLGTKEGGEVITWCTVIYCMPVSVVACGG